ncbi:hypothetical protein WDM22_00685 [Bradyrhizobium septentrionale]|uniref:hypothetical protein n=1 Tax=Bradyrhizobium septentrionale TaxID=1404411 RepID=UPI0030CAC383
MTAEERLAQIRGLAPEKSPSVRVLSAATAHSDCRVAMLALATRTNLDRLCEGTYFEVAFGQDPQAFQRGQMFERRVKDHGYGALIQLLREHAGFPLTSVRIEDLRSRTPPNMEGLRQRAAETKRLLRRIARNAPDAPNIIDGAVLTCSIAGKVAYFEADSLAAAANGRVHVVEIKSFPYTDGRCDPDKLGAASDQAAWYALLGRRQLAEDEISPDIIAPDGFIIVAQGLGLTPTLLPQNLDARIRRAERLLETTPDPRQILAQVPNDLQFPAMNVEPEQRVELLEEILDTVGTAYRPACMRDCGAARLCRSRAHESSDVALCGNEIVRQLPGIPTLSRALELSEGLPAAPDEKHVAAGLSLAATVYDRALRRGAL